MVNGMEACEWLSKLRSFFGYPKHKVPYYNEDPKGHHNFDNRSCKNEMESRGCSGLRFGYRE